MHSGMSNDTTMLHGGNGGVSSSSDFVRLPVSASPRTEQALALLAQAAGQASRSSSSSSSSENSHESSNHHRSSSHEHSAIMSGDDGQGQDDNGVNISFNLNITSTSSSRPVATSAPRTVGKSRSVGTNNSDHANSGDRKGHLHEQAYMIFDAMINEENDASPTMRSPKLRDHHNEEDEEEGEDGDETCSPRISTSIMDLSEVGGSGAGHIPSSSSSSSSSSSYTKGIENEEVAAAGGVGIAYQSNHPSYSQKQQPPSSQQQPPQSHPSRKNKYVLSMSNDRSMNSTDGHNHSHSSGNNANDETIIVRFSAECPVTEGNFPTSGVSSPIGADGNSPLNNNYLDDTIPFPASANKPTREGRYDGNGSEVFIDMDGPNTTTLSGGINTINTGATTTTNKRKRGVKLMEDTTSNSGNVTDYVDGSTLLDQSLDQGSSSMDASMMMNNSNITSSRGHGRRSSSRSTTTTTATTTTGNHIDRHVSFYVHVSFCMYMSNTHIAIH